MAADLGGTFVDGLRGRWNGGGDGRGGREGGGEKSEELHVVVLWA